MSKLKVGDRVESKTVVGNKHIKRAIGTIINITTVAYVCVEFDVNIGGHDGNGIGRDRHCWNVNISELVLLGPISTEPEYEVF